MTISLTLYEFKTTAKHPLQGPPQPPPSKPSSAKTRPVATVLPSTSSSQATSINRPVVHPTVPIIVPSPQELVPNNNTVCKYTCMLLFLEVDYRLEMCIGI